ncbi:MAG: hypothetical protein Q7W30_00445 [Coriobacteriia bacterium]|nr:hypothetical protein [Coriobacteriia bacterium]
MSDPAATDTVEPRFSRPVQVLLTIAFFAAIAAVIGVLVLVSTITPTLRPRHKGWGRATCSVCHPPSKVHAKERYAPDTCAPCHGSNGAKETTSKHKGWKRTDCFASGCHTTVKVHPAGGFTLKGCPECHGPNGPAPATK